MAAKASGALFACPACRDNTTFRDAAHARGVALSDAVPDYVVTGEAESAARCCFRGEACVSPRGPYYDATGCRPTRRPYPV